MSKRILNKDIRKTMTTSIGRFLSIATLMALGVFALVGLRLSGPDMRATAERFYESHHLADLTVVSDLGLDASDQATISKTSNLKQADYGYFEDVTISSSHTSVRIFSEPGKLSTYQVKSGKLPDATDEIALDYLQAGKYKLGDEVSFDSPQTGDILNNHRFKIVGFVKSSEFVDKTNFGATTVGTGQLDSYAVVNKAAFTSQVYTIARLSLTDTAGLSPYSDLYANRVEEDQRKIEDLLKQEAPTRLSNLTNQKLQLLDQQLALATASADSAAIEQLNQEKTQLAQLPLPTYTVSDRKEGNPGYQVYQENSERVDILAYIFPIIFFAVAALVALTTMTRFVDEERGNIALYKSLGYNNRQIRRKFLIYGLVSSLSGAIVGLLLGHTLLPLVTFEAYSASSTFEDLTLLFSSENSLLALFLAVACTVFPAYFVSTRDLREVPAQLFQPKAPKIGAKIFLERLPKIWQSFSFTYKVAARNLFRSKKRMLMTLFGVAGCTALLITGFGLRDSLSRIENRQFSQIIHYDLVAIQNPAATSSDLTSLEKLLSSNEIQRKTTVHFEQVTATTGGNKNTQTIGLFVPKTGAEAAFSDFVSLKNAATNGKKMTLSQNSGAIISEKLAKLAKLKVGDQLTVETASKKVVKIKISAIAEMYVGHDLFMTSSAYAQAFSEDPSQNASLIKLKDSSKQNIQDVSSLFMKNPAVSALSQNLTNQTIIENFVNGINAIIVILIVCAILLAIVVLYNLTSINVAERIRELSTLKVLGFYDYESTLYIYRETFFLSIIGIFLGYGFGAIIHAIMISQLPPDEIFLVPGLTPLNLMLSAGLTLIVTLLLSLIVHRRLKKVDMLSALKSVD